jgi:hypothetical protein
MVQNPLEREDDLDQFPQASSHDDFNLSSPHASTLKVPLDVIPGESIT